MYEDMLNLRSGTSGQCHQVGNVKSVASKFGVCFKNVISLMKNVYSLTSLMF